MDLYSQTCVQRPFSIPELEAVVGRWSFFRSRYMLERLKLGLQNVGRCRQVVVNSGLTASLNLCTLFLCVCFRKNYKFYWLLVVVQLKLKMKFLFDKEKKCQFVFFRNIIGTKKYFLDRVCHWFILWKKFNLCPLLA